MPYKDKKDLYKAQIQRWKDRKVKAIDYLGGECKDCGYKGHPNVYDFHHRDAATKKYTWTKLRLRSWTDVIEELDKCDLLCANCHRLRHAFE